MKRSVKIVIISVVSIIVLIGLAAVVMFWMMTKPLYKYGNVSIGENLHSPLEPPEQSDTALWQVESDITLHFDVYGNGRPVIIVHGGPGIPYANAWKGLKSLEDRFAFYYYHQRGAGNSSRPIDHFESKNYSKNVAQLEKTLGIGAQIADIERIRRILKEEKLVLIGHSFGGFIASLYAAEFPDKVEKLILIAPADMLSPPEKGNNFFDAVRDRLPDEELTKYDTLVKEYFNFGGIFKNTDKDLVDLQMQIGKYLIMGMGYDGSLINTGPTPGGWSTFAVYFSTGRSPNFQDAMGHITAPTLIIHGNDDDISLNGSREYEQSIPNAKFVSIGCTESSSFSGHFIYDDCPNEFVKTVSEFLNF